MKGKLYLIPTLLGGENVNECIPLEAQKKIIELRYFIVENIKSARRFLRKIDRTFPIDDSHFFELNKRTDVSKISTFLRPVMEGNNIGLMSDAGCPGVADPGALIVGEAHKKNIYVTPLVGPSSILLALMGSGFNGQQFMFHGYLPKERKQRIQKLKDLEHDVFRKGVTHLFMDTPFRNMNVLDDLLNELSDTTMLSIASNITLPSENIRTLSVKEWRENAYDLTKKPTIFSLGKLE